MWGPLSTILAGVVLTQIVPGEGTPEVVFQDQMPEALPRPHGPDLETHWEWVSEGTAWPRIPP